MKHCICLFFGFLFVLMQFSCSNDDDVVCSLKTLPMTVFTRDSFALQVVPAKSGWTFSSKNENIASVTTRGLVKTHVMGTTTLYARFAATGFVDSVQVTVKPRTTFYQEPYLTFFVPQQTIIDFEELDYYAIGRGEKWLCTYYSRECGTGYLFDLVYYFNSNDQYEFSSLGFNGVVANDVTEHVSERYVFIRKKSDGNRVYTYYINPDSSVIVAKYTMQNELWLSYHPYSIGAMEAIQNDTIGVVFDE